MGFGDFGTHYEVSSLGRVRSLPRTTRWKNGRMRSYPGQIIRDAERGAGYRGVLLCFGGLKMCAYTHRMVCHAFHGPPKGERLEAAHINGVRSDNRAENLRWATRTENEADKLLHGTRGSGELAPNAKCTREQALGVLAACGTHSAIAGHMGMTPANVAAIRNGRSWRCLRG